MTAEGNSVLDALGRHASCRRYREDAVPEGDVERIVGAAQRAATSSNLQMWSAVVVREQAARDTLAHLCGDQKHIRQAPVFIAWCADRKRLDRVAEVRGQVQDTGFVESFLVAAVDTAIAMQNATVALEALGYGSCYIGGIRNDVPAVRALLKLPERVIPIAGMTLGVPARSSRPRPRLDIAAVLHREEYRPVDEGILKEYDRAMRDTGIYRGRHMPGPPVDEEEYGWMEHSARRVSTPSRTALRAAIEAAGFPLE